MRGPRAAMQDVEIVDVDTGADVSVLGTDPEDPAAEAARARRLARRRRLLRRWWPVPALALAALLGTQALLDARERAEVAARQRVEGVLRTVDAGLEPTRRLAQDVAPVLFSGIRAGDLRIGPGGNPWEGPRTLVAVDASGATVWETSLEAGHREVEDTGLGTEYPLCLGAGDPAEVVDCVVVDRTATDPLTAEDGSWVPGPPQAARLMSFDPATGEVRGERAVPPLTAWGGDARLHVLASLVGDVLTVTGWAPGTVLDGTPLWTTDLRVDAGSLTPEALTYPPGAGVARGHVLVQGDLGSWVLDARDGTTQFSGDAYVSVSRTGYLVPPRTPVELVDDDGRTRATLPGSPVVLGVDDGTAPDLEIVVTDDRRLVGYDVAAARELWSLDLPEWLDGTLVLLDGVLYGSDRDAVWAVDVATGLERWRTPAHVLMEAGGVLTDGRNLVTVSATLDLLEAGVTVAAGGGATGGTAGGTGAATMPSARSIVAYSLATGELAWATRLPDDVQGVWAWQGDLLSYGATDVVVLN
ncbi:PQQ-like beta-propeller repeat protein [Cellulomonas hominis]|uniref:outer membrane protein assembly factor BamB family protein n=1 Tax=Cellulomonas hominis TaxID=156981 RepID=UPI001C0F3BC1|nr:PQQ-binding-like beta-propeller repeat protein [Cellulomonas hominis]MBU5422127.1 PQQ-like beta-propeller repeat protein [Cellulomonas hominis]